MSFRIQKSLGNSLFQFAVGRRREFRSIDPDKELSTGASGEFVRHRPEIFYSADVRTIRAPEIPPTRSITSSSLLSSVYDGSSRGRMAMILTGVGGLFILWGLALLAGKGAPGIIPLGLGLIMIAVPFVITVQKRRSIKQQEDGVRREREERDSRNRELLIAYTTSLERLREDPSDANLATVMRENEKLDLPYSVWADTAIGTVLYVGFSTLGRVGPERAADIAKLMDRASEAAGLIAEDSLAVKHAVYSTILWHFLADDRLGEEQLQIVRAIQQGFGIKPEDVPHDTSAEEQFHRLRGVDHRNAPRCETQIPLGPNEYCMYSTEVRQGAGTATTPIYVTNKRVVIGGDRKIEAKVPELDDVIIDADANRVTVRASTLKRPLEFIAEEPIYLAAIMDLATRLDQRPRSFA